MILVDMNMPKGCVECPFSRYSLSGIICGLIKGKTLFRRDDVINQRSPSGICPLKEVRMTLEEAIKKYESDANQMSADIDKANALQLAKWLRELKSYRSEEAYRVDMSMQEWLDKRGDV